MTLNSINCKIGRRSSFDWNESPYDVPDMHFKAGTPCNNYNGYCDVFQRCREVDPSGPLATLRRLLLSDESIASLKRWVVDHWYLLLFIVAAFITIIVSASSSFQWLPIDLSPQKKAIILRIDGTSTSSILISCTFYCHSSHQINFILLYATGITNFIDQQ